MKIRVTALALCLCLVGVAHAQAVELGNGLRTAIDARMADELSAYTETFTGVAVDCESDMLRDDGTPIWPHESCWDVEFRCDQRVAFEVAIAEVIASSLPGADGWEWGRALDPSDGWMRAKHIDGGYLGRRHPDGGRLQATSKSVEGSRSGMDTCSVRLTVRLGN